MGIFSVRDKVGIYRLGRNDALKNSYVKRFPGRQPPSILIFPPLFAILAFLYAQFFLKTHLILKKNRKKLLNIN